MADVSSALYLGGPRDKVEALYQLRNDLWSTRSKGWDAHWRELNDFISPRRSRFIASDRNRGNLRNSKIIDSTAGFAHRTLSSGLHAGLTSPARPWFKLTTPDPDLAERQAVKEWLHLVTQRMLAVFLSTNLYNALPTVYGDMGTFGTGCMSVLQDTHDLFRTYHYPIGSYALGLDERNVTTSFVREYTMSVRMIVQQFLVRPDRTLDWSKVSRTVKKLYDEKQYESEVPITWIVTPNDYRRDDRLEAKYLPWSSCYFETGNSGPQRALLSEGGFRSFPIFAPRWQVTGEDVYGTDSPGMLALADVKQLQSQQRKKGQALEKIVDPPLQAPTSVKTQKVSLFPGEITYVDQNNPNGGIRPIHETQINLRDMTQDLYEVQQRINRAYFVDLFMMLANSDPSRGMQPITAREVEERHEEKLLALGPVLERTNDELLDPMVDRCYELMDQNGLIPDPPSELQGVKLRVEYVSIMAQAQKLVGVVGLDRFVASVFPIYQVHPEIKHKVDAFRLVDDYGNSLGIDPRILRTDEQASASLQQEQQAAQAQMEADAAAKAGAAMKDASQADMTGDNALTRLAASMGAPAPGGPGVPM